MRGSTKRLTVQVDKDIDLIRDHLRKETGIDHSYVQVFQYLINFYMTRANEPRSKWAPLCKN